MGEIECYDVHEYNMQTGKYEKTGERECSVDVDAFETLQDLIEFLAERRIRFDEVTIQGMYGEPTTATWPEPVA